MEEINRLNKLYSYAFYSLALLVLIASAIANSGYALISAILLLLSAIYLNSGHMINNMLIKRSKVIMIKNGTEHKCVHIFAYGKQMNCVTFMKVIAAVLF